MLRVLLAVGLPLAVLASWTGYHAVLAKHGVPVELPVVGYDPRDLLSGHYLTYRVDYGQPVCPAEAAAAAEEEERCVCLTTPKSALSSAHWHGRCDERPDCRSWLAGTCSAGQFSAGIERYYFSDEFTGLLALVPPGATIEVRLDGLGGGQVTGMKIGGASLRDWLEQQTRDKKP